MVEKTSLLGRIFGRGRGRPAHEPPRRSLPWATMLNLFGRQISDKKATYKPVPRNLRAFARSPVLRRAINALKNPVAMMSWEVVPDEGVEWNPELKRQAQIVTNVLNRPNETDDFMSLMHQLIEDWTMGALVLEMQTGGDPDHPVYLWPVDCLSIQIFPDWKPSSPNSARYQQTIGYGNLAASATKTVYFRDDELIYMRPNPSTANPYGLGPAEIVFDDVARILGVSEFAGELSSNARPSILLDLGDGMSADDLMAFRIYFRDEIEGRGTTPITALTEQTQTGKTRGPTVHRLFPEGDSALFLKYQEFLRGVVALGFDLSPQNLNLERDVNRNTGEVSEDRDWAQAIRPLAMGVASQFTRHLIKGKLGFSQLQFRFNGLDREDERSTAEIMRIYYSINTFTANEIRKRLGMPPAANQWGDMTAADVAIATMAAKGAAMVDDPALGGGSPKSPLAAKVGTTKNRSVANPKTASHREPRDSG